MKEFFEIVGAITLLTGVVYFIWQLFFIFKKDIKNFRINYFSIKQFSKRVLLYLYLSLIINVFLFLFGFLSDSIGTDLVAITTLLILFIGIMNDSK